MAEAMNISGMQEDQENDLAESVELSVDVSGQRAVFSPSPRKRAVRRSRDVSAGSDVTMLSPNKGVPGSAEKRKVLAENRHDTGSGQNEAAAGDEPTFKKARFTRAALTAAYSAPYFAAPVTWEADAGSDISALCLGDKRLVVGTSDGRVLYLDFDGHVTRVQQLPLPVKSLVRDGPFLYAWCPAQLSFDKWKGALYDLTPDFPRFLFDVENLGEWVTMATMRQGLLVLADDKGSVAMLGANGDVRWFQQATDGRGTSKMLLADETGIYLGHRKKVVKYDPADGSEMWTYEATGRGVTIHQGIQDEKHVFVEIGSKVLKLAKEDGSVVLEFVPLRHRASNVCTGSGILVTGSCPTVIFDLETGEEKFRMNFAGRLNDAIMAMHPSGRLFAVWDKVYCMDLTPEAVERAVEGRSLRTRQLTVTSAAGSGDGGEDAVTRTSEQGGGTTLEVRQDAEGRVSVFPVDGLYHSGWEVRFPKHLQELGKRYIVDALVPYDHYQFYSIQGEIKELVQAEDEDKTPEEETANSEEGENEKQEETPVTESPVE